MSTSIINTIIIGAAYLVLFASAELLYYKFKVRAEVTRKYVHIVTGIISLLFPVMLGSHWLVLILAISFLVLLTVSIRYNFLASINAVGRKTVGSLMYPIIIYGCYFVFEQTQQIEYYYIPILVMAICDPIAAFMGKGFKYGTFKLFGYEKNFSGSIGFFIGANIVSMILLFAFIESTTFKIVIAAIFLSLITAIAEAISHKGLDNLTIPAIALFGLKILHSYWF